MLPIQGASGKYFDLEEYQMPSTVATSRVFHFARR
jgi:hypothetical protein